MNFRNTVVALVACSCLSLRADNKSKQLPSGILKALAADEANYCAQFLDSFKKGCHKNFQANLLWYQLLITPSGQAAILVENHNMGYCGSAGCSLYLFVQQPNAEFVQVLGTNGETGTLDRIIVLKNVTNDHYDLQKTWADGNTQTIYRWNGVRYLAQP